MSALKWTAAEMRHVLGRAPIEAAVIDKGDHAVAVVLAHSHRDDCATVDEAKAAVEKHMLSLLTDLQAHFAPVLRWERTTHEYMRDARLGRWRLEATDGVWCVSLYEAGSDSRRVFLASGIGTGPEANHLEENQRAAEAALRSLGVAFRVEGEG